MEFDLGINKQAVEDFADVLLKKFSKSSTTPEVVKALVGVFVCLLYCPLH